MYIIRIFLKQYSVAFVIYVIVGLVLAFGNTWIVVLMNEYFRGIINGTRIGPDYTFLVYYCSLLFILLILNTWLIRNMTFACYKVAYQLRLTIVEAMKICSLSVIKKYQPMVYTSLTRDINIIAPALTGLINTTVSSITVTLCLVYLGSLSPLLLFFVSIVTLLSIGVHLWSMKKSKSHVTIAWESENRFVRYLNAMLSGFKEIKLNSKKGDDIVKREVEPSIREYRDNSFKGRYFLLRSNIISQFIYNIYLVVPLVVIPMYLNDKALLVNFIFISLYAAGPLRVIIGALSGIGEANISAKRFLKFWDDLKSSQLSETLDHNKALSIEVTKIDLEGIEFFYKNKTTDIEPFKLGPINLEINANEILFIYGGNGSGKSTLINVLLGLYPVGKGYILLNGVQIKNDDIPAYQKLFGVVFSDFYLFDKFYGIENIENSDVKRYLELFELDDKVEFIDNKFSTTELSLGQRKRLALIEVLLLKRPYIVLDEWAADQDPYFRKKFYKIILPQLKMEGFTIIAITHDDKYYHISDKLFKMEYGQLLPCVVEQVQSNF